MGTNLKESDKDLSRLESWLVIVGVTLSPLWFITPFKINIIPTDILLIIVAIIYVCRSGNYPLLSSKWVNIGFLIFLFSASISTIFSPVPIRSLFGIFQYMIIFFIVIPFVYLAATNRRSQYYMILGLFGTLGMLLVITVVESLEVNQLRNINLWYSNKNQLYWLIASIGILCMYLAASEEYSPITRIMALSIVPITVLFVVFSYTFSGIILLSVSIWFLLLLLVVWKYGRGILLAIYLGLSIIAGLISSYIIYLIWDVIWVQGNIESRQLQYGAAVQATNIYPPFGYGLQSENIVIEGIMPIGPATTIHNLWLSFLVEVGIVGVIGFMIAMVAWFREVIVTNIQNISRIPFIYLASSAIFLGMLTFTLFHYPQVRRFWWIMFAISWASISDINASD
ncbi:O-antigen ligase family protein [Natrialbaceae archaeon A-CW1-1]